MYISRNIAPVSFLPATSSLSQPLPPTVCLKPLHMGTIIKTVGLCSLCNMRSSASFALLSMKEQNQQRILHPPKCNLSNKWTALKGDWTDHWQKNHLLRCNLEVKCLNKECGQLTNTWEPQNCQIWFNTQTWKMQHFANVNHNCTYSQAWLKNEQNSES